MLRIGVMEGVLKQPRQQLFECARRLGFEGVEIEVRGDREQLRQWSATGAPISSLICGVDGAGHPELEPRIAARERLQQAIRDAAELRVGGILWPHFELRNLDDADAVERFVADVSACMPEAEQRSVVVAWENSLNAADTRAIIDRVGSDYFRCYFDFANAAKRGADPADELAALSGYLYQIHAKNINKQHLEAPGVDLTACLTALRQQGYGGWIVLETPSGDDPLASAEHNLRVLREAWAALSA